MVPTTSADYKELELRFLRIYDNLPLDERTKVIVFLDDEPVSWKLARNYIAHNPEKAKRILEKLKKLKII